NAERSERAVDLRVPSRGRDAVRHVLLAQPPQEGDRARKRPALGQQLAEKLAMPGLDPAGVVVAQRLSDLAGDGTSEETAAHADTAMDLPAVDRKPGLRERPLPREDVRVDGVNERSIEIENECAHA